MIQKVILVILIIFAACLQIGLSLAWPLVVPEIILAAAIALALADKLTSAYWWVGIGATMLDLIIGSLSGLHLLTMGLILLVIAYLIRSYFSQPSLPIATTAAFACVGIYELVFSFLTKGYHYFIIIPTLTSTLLTVIIYTLLIRSRQREVIRLG